MTEWAWEFRAQYCRLGCELCDDVAEEDRREDTGCNSGRVLIHFSLELLELRACLVCVNHSKPETNSLVTENESLLGVCTITKPELLSVLVEDFC